MTELTVKCALLLLLSGAALFFDLRTGKIPNILILFGLLAACVLRTAVFGAEGVLSFLAGAGFPFLILFLLFHLGMMGAGDIKLLMAAGGLLGWPGSLRFFVLSILSFWNTRFRNCFCRTRAVFRPVQIFQGLCQEGSSDRRGVPIQDGRRAA